jgi:4-aminobutyrate aminotransferase-like enzyme
MYRASSAGERFMKNLGEIQKRRPILGDVRGKGLMIGLEIVDPATQAPAADAAKKMEKSMLQRGVLISTTGVNANVLRITPPLVISDAQIDRACEAVDAALAEASAP